MVSFTGPFDDSRLDGADLAMPFPRRTIPNNQIPFTFRWNGPIASIEKPIRHNRSVHKFLAIRSRFLPSYELDFKPGSSFLFFFFLVSLHQNGATSSAVAISVGRGPSCRFPFFFFDDCVGARNGSGRRSFLFTHQYAFHASCENSW